jgi:DNA-binding MarR family transcriptional regulator
MVTKSEAAREIVKLLPAVAINLRLAALMDRDGIDLTANQLLALQLVALAPDGRMKAGEIAERLGISSQAATALVDRLVGAGVVDRSHGKDRRVVWVQVTEAGHGLLDGLAIGLEKLITAAIETGYDAATLDGLLDGLRRVASFADRIGDPLARSSLRHRRAADSHLPL